MLAIAQLSFISTSFPGTCSSTAASACDFKVAVRKLNHSGAGWRISIRRYLNSMSPSWKARSHHDSISVIFLFTVVSMVFETMKLAIQDMTSTLPQGTTQMRMQVYNKSIYAVWADCSYKYTFWNYLICHQFNRPPMLSSLLQQSSRSIQTSMMDSCESPSGANKQKRIVSV